MKLPWDKVRFAGVFVVMLFAFCGYYFTYSTLNKHFVQYSSLPEHFTIKVYDASRDDTAFFNFPIVSKMPERLPDSIAKSDIFQNKPLLFHYNEIFLVWLALISVMIAIASGAFPVFLAKIVEAVKDFRISGPQVMLSIVLTLLIITFLILTNSALSGYYKPEQIISDFKILLTDNTLIPGTVTVAVLLLFPIITLIFLVAPASENIKTSERTSWQLKLAALRFEKLNGILNNALQVLAIIVVFSVLTSSALRLSIKSSFQIEGYDIFPTYVSYVYGLYFTVILAIIYVPSYFYLKQRYSVFKSSVLSSGNLSPENASAILGIVKIENSVVDNMKVALTVLAPLISSFLPEALHIF